ncbi:MAG: undecaprenyl-phosphate glucose phosphotransferase [Candidatus Theseobacter exili]|nr:undecaprenyl-phosphate glucose phosphotransferase [Candidatus Theseobacter exili]
MAKQKGFYLLLQILTALGDGFLLYLSFLLSFWIRFHSGLFTIPRGIPSFNIYLEAFLLAVLVLILVLQSKGFYHKRLGFQVQTIQVVDVAKALTIGYIILMALSFVYRKEVAFSRVFMMIAWLLSIPMIAAFRMFVDNLTDYYERKHSETKRILLIGSGENAERLIRGLKTIIRTNFEIAGIVTCQESQVGELYGYPVIGGILDTTGILQKEDIDEVILTVSNLDHSLILQIILECEKQMISFKMVPDMFEIVASQVEMDNVDGVPILGLKEFPLEKFWNRLVKRFIDILGALSGLVVGFPLYFICGLLIKHDSKGSVFYKQERVGEDGKQFIMFKFRTMVLHAEEKTGPVMAKESDSRCTKIGAILRSYNLDELPQLINVLKGDMSLVGPRPERPHFVNEFRSNIPRYMSRHKVKSGMTGWAQVNGLRGNTSISERVKYDLFYMENWSIWLDMKIILLTFRRKNGMKQKAQKKK